MKPKQLRVVLAPYLPEMYRDGMTAQQISQTTGLSVRTILRILYAAGLRPGDRGSNNLEHWATHVKALCESVSSPNCQF